MKTKQTGKQNTPQFRKELKAIREMLRYIYDDVSKDPDLATIATELYSALMKSEVLMSESEHRGTKGSRVAGAGVGEIMGVGSRSRGRKQ